MPVSPDGGEDRLSRLDPDLAAASTHDGAPPAAPPHIVERPRWGSRRYQLAAMLLAVALLLVLVLLALGGHSTGTVGIPAGKPLTLFAAPLAGSTLVGDANLHPPCTAARHDRRALNVCLLLTRGPLALVFFDPQNSKCARAVSTLQALAGRGVQVAAVAIDTGPRPAAAAVRAHRWTIPVAYDRDGAVGAAYGVVICPLIELARRDGVVFERLIGNRWLSPAALGAQLSRLRSG